MLKAFLLFTMAVREKEDEGNLHLYNTWIVVGNVIMWTKYCNV